MKSPFPGMHPYLEKRWGDVHTRLCAYISAALQPELPRGLRARAQEDVRLEESADPKTRQRFEGDAVIVEVSRSTGRTSSPGAVATVEPIIVRQIPVLTRNRWVEILDTTAGNRVVTVVEILSPGNKLSTKLNKRYRSKLDRYQQAGVSIVEIDLLRTSRSRLSITQQGIPENRHAAYYTCVNRSADPFEWVIYPMPLREHLPTIPIPLRETDSEIGLKLQPLIDKVYQEGGHDDIDYGKGPPEPPLSKADAKWAAGLIAKRGTSRKSA